MNRGDQEPNIEEFHIEPEPSHIGHMNHDHGKQAMMSIYEKDSSCEIQCLPKTDTETEVFREVPAASNGVLRRRFRANGAQDENGLEEPELRRISLEEERQEDNAEKLSPLRAFQGSEVRVSSRNRNSSDVEYGDDDGASSVCSENIYGSADFMSLPCDASSKWSTWGPNSRIRRRERESLIESLEKQRRESVENRLKELRIPNKRHSVSSSLSTSEMPIIAKSKPMKNATLPKQMRRSSYQSVIVTPFFAKSGVSVTRPLLLGLGPEMRERRGSLVSPNVETPTRSAGETESFPLRAAGSLSCIEQFAAPRKNLVSTKPMRLLPSEMTMRKSDDAVESKATLTSSPSTKIQTSISDQWSDASLKNGSLNNYPAQGLKEIHHIRQDSFSNRNKQIRDQNRPDFAENSGDSSETGQESLGKPDVLPRIISSSKTDSPIVSRKVYSVTEALLPVTNYRPPSVETVETTESEEEFRGVSSTDKLPEKLLNGNYSLKKESCSDKSSDTSSTDNDDRHYEIKNSVTLNLQTPASIETCREDKTTLGNPAFCLQTSSTSQETFLLINPQPERDLKTKTNAGLDLDNSWPRNVPYSANQNKVPVYPAVSKKYCSDIQIQVKEVEPIFPASFGQSSNQAYCNGESREDLLKERDQTPVDDDVDTVTPNWSSYPGPLPDGFRSSDLNDFNTTSKPVEVDITIEAPERSVSTLEINLQVPPSVDEREQVSKNEAWQTGKYDSPYDPTKSKVSTVLSLRADANVDIRPDLGFNDQRKRIIVKNVTREVDPFYTPQKSVERNEMFVKQDSSPTTARTLTLPRKYRSRSMNQFESQTRSPGTPQQELSYTPNQELADGVGASTPDDLSAEVTPSKANVTRIAFYSKKDEQRTKFRDGERTRSSFEAIGGILQSGDSWQASVVKREDRWKDSRMSAESSSSPEKTPSVERIWETLEQPRTRLTKRNFRLESGSEIVGAKTEKPQYLQRNRVASNGGTGEAKADVLVRSTSLQEPIAEGYVGESSLLEIGVLKGGLGLGFCIEGGKDGPYGDRPITVKRLFRGSSDSKFSSGTKDGLRAGDEILSANGRDMTLLSRFVAWNFLKTLPEGTIKLVVRRRTQQPDSNQLQ